MRSVFLILILAVSGCGRDVSPAAVAAAELAEPAAVVERPAVAPMDDATMIMIQSLGRLPVEESIRKRVPDWTGTASVMRGGQQFLLQPEANEHNATHLVVAKVKFYTPELDESVAIWALYCRDGKPLAAKNLNLGLWAE